MRRHVPPLHPTPDDRSMIVPGRRQGPIVPESRDSASNAGQPAASLFFRTFFIFREYVAGRWGMVFRVRSARLCRGADRPSVGVREEGRERGSGRHSKAAQGAVIGRNRTDWWRLRATDGVRANWSGLPGGCRVAAAVVSGNNRPGCLSAPPNGSLRGSCFRWPMRV